MANILELERFRDTGVVEEAGVVCMVFVLLEEGALRCVEVETVKITENGRDRGEDFLGFDKFTAGRRFDKNFDVIGVVSVHGDDVTVEQDIAPQLGLRFSV